MVRYEIKRNSRNAVLRTIAWVLGISTLVTLMSIGSCAYFDYRARKNSSAQPGVSHHKTTAVSTHEATIDARAVCSLASNVEVGEALGAVVSSTNKGTSTCEYTSSVGRNLTVELTPQAGAMALELAVMAMKAQTKGQSAVRRIVGIGDEAYAGRKGSTLMFRKGNTVVNVNVHTDGNSFRAVIDIGRKIATRLP